MSFTRFLFLVFFWSSAGVDTSEQSNELQLKQSFYQWSVTSQPHTLPTQDAPAGRLSWLITSCKWKGQGSDLCRMIGNCPWLQTHHCFNKSYLINHRHFNCDVFKLCSYPEIDDCCWLIQILMKVILTETSRIIYTEMKFTNYWKINK